MREVEFRGRRLDNGEWVYGDLCCHYENQRRFIACDQMFYTHAECGIERLVSERFHEVDPATVGQYTGLRDKNGQEIYEGDIIQTFFSFAPGDAGYGVSQRPFVVKWEQGRTRFRAFKPQANGRHLPHLLDIIDFFEMQAKLYEVIGNIHDNPELLK